MEGFSNTEVVTNQGVILNHLSDLAHSHSPVKITPSQASSSWMIDSAISGIQPGANSLLLHKPDARASKYLDNCKEELEVSCYTPHGVIRFNSNYVPSALPRLESTIRFQMPEKLVKAQRRAHTRVKVSHLENSILLHVRKELQLTGVCLDLSVAGALICLHRNKRGVDLGETIDRCEIKIDQLVTINQAVKICSIGSKRGKLLVGIQFQKMSETGAETLGNLLNYIECQNSNS